jgi:hypothetical protein
MEILGQVFMAVVSAIQWLYEGFVVSISDSRYWGGLIVALGGGWILGRVWPRREPGCEAVDSDEDDWDEDDWDEDDEDAAAWWVMFGR